MKDYKNNPIAKEHYLPLLEYIQTHYCAKEPLAAPAQSFMSESCPADSDRRFVGDICAEQRPAAKARFCADAPAEDLQSYLKQIKDESFAEMLLRKIDEKGMKDSQCYKKACIDRRLFSKIRSNPHCRVRKGTALALILALELPYEESVEMLQKAGYAFSPASKADLIVEYYIKNGIYDLFVINQSLYDFDQVILP